MNLLQPHELASLNRTAAEAAIRERVRCAYLGDHLALTQILGRYKFFVDTRDIGFGAHVLLDGFWEIWLTLFCARNIRNGMTAVDVGANCGYYSLMFAEFVGADGHLLSIEPNPRSVELLRKSIDLNGFSDRVTIHENALGSTDGQRLPFYIPRSEPKNALIVPRGQSHPQDGDLIEVDSYSLDRFCDGRDVNFIKIDAEGSEELILDGMAATISRCRPMIVMEINVARYNDPARFIDRLSAIYDGIYWIDFDSCVKSVTSRELLTSKVGTDWLIVLSPHVPA